MADRRCHRVCERRIRAVGLRPRDNLHREGRALGGHIRQQVFIAGRRVDLLVGERLVVQIDGFAHHSTSEQRTKDVALDAELVLRGYTVLRFTYAQIVYDWDAVERTIARAISTGAHRAA